MPNLGEIFLKYVCPSMGVVMASAMFAGKELSEVERLYEVFDNQQFSQNSDYGSSGSRLAASSAERFSWSFESISVDNANRKLLGMGDLWILYARSVRCSRQSPWSHSVDLAQYGGCQAAVFGHSRKSKTTSTPTA
jgi:hypothetical protein